jgi:hypothetical protein
MKSTLIKRPIYFYIKNKRKIVAIGICFSILFCVVFREFNIIQCCTEKRTSNSIELFHGGMQRNYNKSEDFLTQCYLQKLRNVDCQKLSMGNWRELLNIRRNMQYHKMDYKCSLSHLAENCKVLKSVHNYITEVNTILSDELEFPLAFAIKMHKNPEQAEQLLRTIYRPHNVYCIYVDKKAQTNVYNLMKNIGNCFENVFVVENRINIVYSSINLIEAELECMRILLKTNYTWKYYINLTGQEFPLKTNLEIVKILQRLNGVNDIESYDFPLTYQQRYTKEHVIKDGVIIKTKHLKHSFIKRFQMSKGSAYGTFSRPFIEFILSDDIAGTFLNWLNGSYAPEESAWATLNSLPWAPGGYPREIRHAANSFLSRAIVWSWDGLKCSGHYVRGICIYGPGDLPWLLSRSELFANKFDMERDPVVMDCLEELLGQRSKQNTIGNLNWSLYNSLPHVSYYSKITPFQQSKEYLLRQKQIWLKEHNISTYNTS